MTPTEIAARIRACCPTAAKRLQQLRKQDEELARLQAELAELRERERRERERIAEWMRTTSRAGGVLISIHSSQDIARLADAIERGDHWRRIEPPGDE